MVSEVRHGAVRDHGIAQPFTHDSVIHAEAPTALSDDPRLYLPAPSGIWPGPRQRRLIITPTQPLFHRRPAAPMDLPQKSAPARR
jgi:hypothetical protein